MSYEDTVADVEGRAGRSPEGESCAIDANKWLLSTRVQVVKCLGQHLLAGSGFPKKDDGRVCESDRFHELDYLAE